jgi:hypothetical protein
MDCCDGHTNTVAVMSQPNTKGPAAGHEFGEDTVSVFREVLTADGTHIELQTVGSPSSAARAPSSEAAPGTPLPSTRVLAPVLPLAPLQQRRLHARRHATTYCYDFPAVFENALRSIWAGFQEDGGARFLGAGSLVESMELILENESHYRDSHAQLKQVVRPFGQNDVGVVAWVLTLKTPEWPHGRQAVAVSNDITCVVGAFGPREHAMFRAVCEYAVEQRLPLVYLSANSGARVGLDQDLKKVLNVCTYLVRLQFGGPAGVQRTLATVPDHVHQASAQFPLACALCLLVSACLCCACSSRQTCRSSG